MDGEDLRARVRCGLRQVREDLVPTLREIPNAIRNRRLLFERVVETKGVIVSQYNEEYFERMRDFSQENTDLPDGAFFAKAAEEGFEIEDWEWYAEELKKRIPEK
jgi:hypothetical protein